MRIGVTYFITVVNVFAGRNILTATCFHSPSILHLTKRMITRNNYLFANRPSPILTTLSETIEQSTDTLFTPTPELFSVAPMMAHTHRHYLNYFRHISQYATLYTEMIPSAQMVAAFQSNPAYASSKQLRMTVESVLEILLASRERNEATHLDELVKLPLFHPSTVRSGREQTIILQLGGRNPETLGLAAAMGTFYGYHGINLNCGCPSNAVSGGDRSGGAALMREPSLVAECVKAMSSAIDTAWDILHSNTAVASPAKQQKPALSVKHRLGVRDTTTYDVEADRQRDDHEAFLQCSDFVRAISAGGNISKIQLHGRLGLLGDFDASTDATGSTTDNPPTSLWVPGSQSNTHAAAPSKKMDHKRLQYFAMQKARITTIKNRSVPPLRPHVANLIAAEFPHLQVITNGGIQSLEDLHQRVASDSNVVGAMVGRAAINHPCAFGKVDELWKSHPVCAKPARETVLLNYIQYCQREEEAFATSPLNQGCEPEALLRSLMKLRRRLVAVPFHLFAGEEGNEQYQRRIRKLIAREERHSSYSILKAALSVVPAETLLKPVDQHATEVRNIKVYESARQRAGPLQRTIF